MVYGLLLTYLPPITLNDSWLRYHCTSFPNTGSKTISTYYITKSNCKFEQCDYYTTNPTV